MLTQDQGANSSSILHYALFGGSFNPIHQGHVTIVQHLLTLADKVIVMPTSRSPFKEKNKTLPNELRWEMTQRTFANKENVIVSDFEIQHQGISYTYDTLKQLSIQYPNVLWHFVMGMDTFLSFPQWRQAQKISTIASLWVIRRVGVPFSLTTLKEESVYLEFQQWFGSLLWEESLQTLYHGENEVIRILDFLPPDISSSAIREGRLGSECLPIEAQALYVEHLRRIEPILKK